MLPRDWEEAFANYIPNKWCLAYLKNSQNLTVKKKENEQKTWKDISSKIYTANKHWKGVKYHELSGKRKLKSHEISQLTRIAKIKNKNPKPATTFSAGEDVKKLDWGYTAGEDGKYYNHSRKCGSSLKK